MDYRGNGYGDPNLVRDPLQNQMITYKGVITASSGSGIQNTNDVSEIKGMFTGFEELEENLDQKAQKALSRALKLPHRV